MNEIKLTINAREIVFSFGLGFIGALLEDTGESIEEAVDHLNRNPFYMVPKLMYLSAQYAKTRDGEELDFTMVELTDWIDQDGGVRNETIEKFLTSFTQSLAKGVPKQEGGDPGDPKKK